MTMLQKLSLFCLCICLQHILSGQPSQITQPVPGSPSSLTLKLLPAGSFMMGSPATDSDRKENEGPATVVQVSGFYMSVYETTWEQYNAFFQDEQFSRNNQADAVTRPSPPYLDFTLGMGKDGFPASSMQQYGALMFCRWLYQKTGEFYRLPTEAEWEYACRAGATTAYPFGNDPAALSAYAWYAANSNGKYQPVGTLKPNAFGLYDMLGNVSEWVLDQYDPAYFTAIASQQADPVVKPVKRNPRSVRGGSYADEASALRCAARQPSELVWNRRDPQIPKSRWWNTDAPFVGFRVVKPIVQPDADAVEAFFNTYLLQ